MKVSIIIPIRNEELVIKKIITQLQNKLKHLPYEIILINDFSTDNTVNLVEEIIGTKKQINLYNNKRKGLGGAITEGINRSSGEAICIMMSDAAMIRGTGIAKRSPSYIEKKMRIGDAIYAWIKFD